MGAQFTPSEWQTAKRKDDSRAVFHLEGRLTLPELPILNAPLASCTPGEMALDLSRLRWINASAVATLGDLIHAGAWLVPARPSSSGCFRARRAEKARAT